MPLRRPTDFEWVWTAYAVSIFGTFLAFDAFPLIAILVLDAGPAAVSALAAAGLAAGALVAIPLGPWVEFRRKRPVMIGMDLVRFAALCSVPVAIWTGWLTFVQLLVVSVIVAASGIAFRAASGAYLKRLVPPDELLRANARFESTTWTATVLGPPLGGAAIGVLGPAITVVANAASFLLSALSLGAIRGGEPRPAPRATPRLGDIAEGWRFILGHAELRPLFLNTVLVNALIMATAPLMAVLMLGELGFSPFLYAVAFGVPCVGGIVGARLARRWASQRALIVSGTLRACCSLPLAFVMSGAPGLALVLVTQFALLVAIGVFNPLYATRRLQLTPDDRVSRTLAAWTITSNLTTAALTASWGVLAHLTSLRFAIGAAGVLMLLTPLLLVARRRAPMPSPAVAAPRQLH
ncbi:MFS transporter [Solirubrobacter phytolaccae]|uniref:MFS transporter n=1 Tax=Solirubrobacter phytolaccae TaxID=1404360 RepID=UPI0027E2E118|nr:MFS transporter [Solirubrobacter phytolaccae]